MAYAGDEYLIRAVMQSATGLVQDQVVNDFAFRYLGAGAPDDTAFGELVVSVNEFYNSLPTSGHKLCEYLSNVINRGATHRMDVYKIAAAGLGSPVYSEAWLGPGPFTGTGQVAEAQGVLSYHADYTGVLEESGATRPRARHRGRIYVGPIGANAINAGTPPYMLADVFRDTMAGAANQMGDAGELRDWRWCVWSRADLELRTVVGGWTDNAPDTLRRRGPKATVRSTWTR